jgi:UDP-glucose 4-epimerase
MKVLVTGGAGYIGSHTCLEMLEQGHEVVVMDNMYNASEEALNRVMKLTGKQISLHKIDLLEPEKMDALFVEGKFDAVIHFAGLKAVGESVAKPLFYYENNIAGTVNLLKAMGKGGCKNIVFSSSATVYGDPASVPVLEDFATSATNPYGRTKLFIEHILQDQYNSDKSWNVILLRYFNPVGAHKSGKIGESPKGIPNNLMPYIQQVAVGQRPHLSVFGSDYPTADGTGVRDYIHVVDLAKGHVAALKKVESNPGCKIYNLGTGIGYSVLDMVKAYSKAAGKELKTVMADRRPGDVAVVYGACDRAKEELGWSAQLGMEDMCADSWRWISNNPNGFEVEAQENGCVVT